MNFTSFTCIYTTRSGADIRMSAYDTKWYVYDVEWSYMKSNDITCYTNDITWWIMSKNDSQSISKSWSSQSYSSSDSSSLSFGCTSIRSSPSLDEKRERLVADMTGVPKSAEAESCAKKRRSGYPGVGRTRYLALEYYLRPSTAVEYSSVTKN